MQKTEYASATEAKNCSCQGCTNTECTCAGMENDEERATCNGHKNCSQSGCTFTMKHHEDDYTSESASNIIMIPIDVLHPHPDNPRKNVGDVTELAESIKANGILQNLTVVPYVSPVHKRVMNGLYTVIIGHRRLAAAKQAGLKELPCVVVEMTEKEQVSTMLTENMQRVDLTVYEQAMGFQMMLDLGDSMDEIAEKSGFSKSTVRKRLEIAKLDPKTLKKVSARQLTLGDFDELAKVENLDTRNKILAGMGTANFKNELQKALSEQKTEKRMQEWIAVLKTFAVEDPEASYQTKQFVRNYGKWSGDIDVTVPEDAETVKYYYRVSDSQIDVYKDRDVNQENAKIAAREERERLDRERRQAIADIRVRHYKLRSGFIAELSKADCKKHISDISLFAASALEIGIGIDYDSMNDVGIFVDAENTGFEGLATEHDVIKAAEDCPERLLAWLAYYSMDGDRSGYLWDRWDTEKQKYITIHNDNLTLDIVYRFLCSLGYEMSDEEEAMQNGTHEIFRAENCEPPKEGIR